MKVNNRMLGLMLGVSIFLGMWQIPINGLNSDGQLFLALTLMTVTFWAFGVAQMGFVSGLYLALLIVSGVATPDVVMSPWVGSTMYFIIGAYIIASAVKHSGLGDRLAMYVISKYITTFKSIIVVIFALQIMLSLLIPNSWARSLIIMAIMKQVIDNAKIGTRDAVTIGLTVFASSVPTSMLFLTGESAINLLILEYVEQSVGWLQWLLYMGPPAMGAILLTMGAILLFFKPTSQLQIDRQIMTDKFNALGKMTFKEKKLIAWLTLTIVIWMTDSWHGIDIGWATLGLVMAMGLPVIGDVIDVKQWGDVPVHVLIFLTAAIAIGRVGLVVGANEFIASLMFPMSVPENVILMGLIVVSAAVVVHMFLGSVIAVLSMVIPATLAFTASLDINPLIPVFITYIAVFGHYVLPFHSISILVGVGEENGLFESKDVMRLGLPLLVMVFIVVLAIGLPWWHVVLN